MKVFLDDVRLPPDDTWTLVRDPREFLTIIEQKSDQITAISMDHDLGENVPTGYDLVKTMAEMAMYRGYKLPPVVKVHSANPVGRANMEAVLSRIYTLQGGEPVYSR